MVTTSLVAAWTVVWALAEFTVAKPAIDNAAAADNFTKLDLKLVKLISSDRFAALFNAAL